MSTPLLAAKLVELRKARGFSQQKIADFLGVTREAYSHYERYTREPSLEIICKLAKLYNVDVSELVNEGNVMVSSKPLHTPSPVFSDMPLGGLPQATPSTEDESTIIKNMNHFLKLFSGKNSSLDLTTVTKTDIGVLASYKSLDEQCQREVREFIKFKHSLSRKK